MKSSTIAQRSVIKLVSRLFVLIPIIIIHHHLSCSFIHLSIPTWSLIQNEKGLINTFNHHHSQPGQSRSAPMLSCTTDETANAYCHALWPGGLVLFKTGEHAVQNKKDPNPSPETFRHSKLKSARNLRGAHLPDVHFKSEIRNLWKTSFQLHYISIIKLYVGLSRNSCIWHS